MNLEPIDTSTTAGKARVMQLAAEGRKVAMHPREKAAADALGWISLNGDSDEWDWPHFDYAIIAEPVGRDEVWVLVTERGDAESVWHQHVSAYRSAKREGLKAVRYIRADLAGEGK